MEELKELITDWNKSHPNQLVDESYFVNKKTFKKLLNKIGVETTVMHFPIYSDYREINEKNKHIQEFIFDCYSNYSVKIITINIANSQGEYDFQTFFEF